MLNVGIIGFGLSGRVFHAPLITACEQLSLFAIASSRKQEIANSYPHAQCLSPDEVLAHPEIDVVVIASPNALHAQQAEQAMKAGKHVIVEKPLAIDSEQCLQLQQVADETGKCLSVFHNRRWDSDFLTIQQLIANQSLGSIHSYAAHFHRYRPVVKQRWKELDPQGGGVLYDLGAHLIDQSLCLFGKPEKLWAHIATQRDGAVTPDCFDLHLIYSDKKVQLSCNSLMVEPGPRFQLHGSKGSYAKWGMDPQEQQLAAGLSAKARILGQDANRSEIHLAGQAIVHKPLIKGNYLAFYDNFVAAVTKGETLAVNAHQASEVIALIELATLSHQQQTICSVN
ncbi:oxidoreductase [Agarivorans sp. Toyoura001]|uniref:Gfo/Idh/MocA family oxidoreductase n=1 Tax=Agarivorans sp. Toyoura001 TaxID=2283141 RepID=UPI0010F3E529|nr:Gfo/Idh/MocA family oxidoreductase [Agarivorans sp. Toyoura001]GDY25417.1 oxidoreductase [Agarivorans sp. Toyoura001]